MKLVGGGGKTFRKQRRRSAKRDEERIRGRQGSMINTEQRRIEAMESHHAPRKSRSLHEK